METALPGEILGLRFFFLCALGLRVARVDVWAGFLIALYPIQSRSAISLASDTFGYCNATKIGTVAQRLEQGT